MNENFEKFLVERFLEFYNERHGTAFTYIEKRDERIRNEPSYDYFCKDHKTNTEMGIEMKRLIKRERENEARLEKYFDKYISKEVENIISGNFLVAVDFQQIMSMSRHQQKQFIKNIKQSIIKNREVDSFIDISMNPKASLLKINEVGSTISLFLNNFSSANEDRIEEMIREAQNKFVTTIRTTMIRIILLLEESSSCRRSRIYHVVEKMLVEGATLDEIDGIYNIAIWRKTCIACVFPKDNVFESKFFEPEKYYDLKEYLMLCRSYFR